MKKSIVYSLVMVITISFSASGQQIIQPERGYSPQIGATVSMMEDLKQRITNTVQNISQAETDFILDTLANSVGAMIYHLAAVEYYYQVYTFEGRSLSKEEKIKWGTALDLGAPAREKIKNKPIQFYLKIWDDIRKETLRKLKKKDDKWFKKKIDGTNMNNHWAWYHVMEHQANHMGQIRLILKRF